MRRLWEGVVSSRGPAWRTWCRWEPFFEIFPIIFDDGKHDDDDDEDDGNDESGDDDENSDDDDDEVDANV